MLSISVLWGLRKWPSRENRLSNISKFESLQEICGACSTNPSESSRVGFALLDDSDITTTEGALLFHKSLASELEMSAWVLQHIDMTDTGFVFTARSTDNIVSVTRFFFGHIQRLKVKPLLYYQVEMSLELISYYTTASYDTETPLGLQRLKYRLL